jgi:hypothetical protein
VGGENEKFDTYLLAIDIGSILKKSLCSEQNLCGERGYPHVFTSNSHFSPSNQLKMRPPHDDKLACNTQSIALIFCPSKTQALQKGDKFIAFKSK